LRKNYLHKENQGLRDNQGYSKSPFEKGEFRGISRAYKIPPSSPFSKGGIKNAFNQTEQLFFNSLDRACSIFI
jgi:hypothetical protein